MTGSNIICSRNGVNRAVLCALTATDTLIGIDYNLSELGAAACGTTFLVNVCFILVAEVTKG